MANAGIDLANFATISIDAGAKWFLGGAYTIGQPLALLGSGTLSVQETITTFHTITGGPTLTYHNTVYGTLSNASTIIDSATLTGGTIINQASGVFQGLTGQNATIQNFGTIAGGATLSGAAGTLINEAGGTFTGSVIGGTLENAGVLSGVTLSNALLILDSGNTETGLVVGSGSNVIAGTLSNDITIAAGATLTTNYDPHHAVGAINGTVFNSGTLIAGGSINGVRLSGTGSTFIAQGVATGSVVATGNNELVSVAGGIIQSGITLQGTSDTLSIFSGFSSQAIATPGNAMFCCLNGTGTLQRSLPAPSPI